MEGGENHLHSTAWEIRDSSLVTAVGHTVMTEKDTL